MTATTTAASASSDTARARYIISSGWTHIFLEGRREVERETRWVYDRATRQLARLDIRRDHKWRESSRVEQQDVLDSLLNGNEGCLEDPSTWDFDLTNEMPAWD